MANEQPKNLQSQQPAAPSQDRVAVLEAQVNALMKLLAAQQPVLQPVAMEQEREKEFQERALELGKSCQQRTQELARKQFAADCKFEYPVSMPTNKEQLSLLIPARSPEEAKGRYVAICGINSIDHDKRVEIGSPVPAQAA